MFVGFFFPSSYLIRFIKVSQITKLITQEKDAKVERIFTFYQVPIKN